MSSHNLQGKPKRRFGRRWWEWVRWSKRDRKWEKRRQAIADKRHGRVGKAPLGLLALAAVWCALAGLFGRGRK
ncbi:MAG: hypothetical protein AB9900_12570 [Humidesulfovibrio sp.]